MTITEFERQRRRVEGTRRHARVSKALAEGTDLFWKLVQRWPSVVGHVLLDIFGKDRGAGQARTDQLHREFCSTGGGGWGVSAFTRRVSDG